jgi:hypothetical protein
VFFFIQEFFKAFFFVWDKPGGLFGSNGKAVNEYVSLSKAAGCFWSLIVCKYGHEDGKAVSITTFRSILT